MPRVFEVHRQETSATRVGRLIIMPAIVHQSQSGYSSGRFAILEQSESQQPNGLVLVSVLYSVSPLSSAAIGGAFYLDAPPPIFPSCVARETLQGRQGLYMVDFSTEKQNGLWYVSANYAGARNFGVVRGQKPFIVRDNESRVTPAIRILAGYDITPEDPPRQIAQYDTVIVRFIAQVVTTEVAGVGGGLFDLETTEQASSLIYRVEYGNLERSAPDVRTRFTLPSPKALLDNFKPYVEVSTSIKNVTNVVIVATTTRNVVFDPLALDNATSL